jgi:hypothetical protein
LVKQWKENNLRKSSVVKNSRKRKTDVKVLLVKEWKESYLRKSIAGKTVKRE